MPKGRIDEIDGLRAIAMTAVIAQHCNLTRLGWTGVWLFFVISGYVVSRNFLSREYVASGWTHQYRNFMVRRFFRIVPVYLLYIAIACVALAFAGSAAPFWDLPFMLTFTYNWQMILWPNLEGWGGFFHLWSLSVEEQFYVIYPLLFLLLPTRMYLGAMIGLVAAGPLLRLAYAAFLGRFSSDVSWLSIAVYEASFAHFDAFLIGALIAWYEDDIRRNKLVAGLASGAVILAGAAYMAACWYANHPARGGSAEVFRNAFLSIPFDNGPEVFAYSVINLVSAAALIGAVLQTRVMRPLAWPFVALVGRISYGGYLYHALVVSVVTALLSTVNFSSLLARIGLFAIVWPLSIIAAYASYRWFETPIIRWSRRRSSTAPATAPPETLPRSLGFN